MMLMTISEVTRAFDVSTRMLRYYDQIGLLPSIRPDGYAYRVYDEAAVNRLRQIIALRKLRIPLKKIKRIFESAEQTELVATLQESLAELDTEITALQTIRSVLRAFIARLGEASQPQLKLEMLDDTEIIGVIEALSLSKISFKEAHSMDDLNKANETLSALRNVRIIYLPPCTVASSHYFGENPEDVAGKRLKDFVRSVKLQEMKPDLRVYGFNNPTPQGSEPYGYEFWVTIPDDLDVPAPLEKKRFAGGLYAAHCIKMGDFNEWGVFFEWVQNSAEYDYDAREPLGMGGAMEEHLNAYSCYAGGTQFIQLDLLIPIKAKQ